MHKATITQDMCGSPQCGATSTNSLSSLLSSVNFLTCTKLSGFYEQNEMNTDE
jgi:hypothetical protein